jgi:hypothetical protein
MTVTEALHEIGAELDRARQIHPEWPRDQIHAAAIVAEESGELIRAAINREYGRGVHAADDLEMRTEAIHTAATAIRFLVGG